MSKVRWSASEDAAIAEFYPRHGSRWGGWGEVLPGRTITSIAARASRTGVSRRKERGRHRATSEEELVSRCMDEGMTPSEIDGSMGWEPGTTSKTLGFIWRRERD